LGNNAWAKHGIMARENCSPGSRYSYVHDQNNAAGDSANGTAFQWREAQDIDAVWDGASPVFDQHADTLRLKREGSLFIGYAFDEDGSLAGLPGEWVELGSHDWSFGGDPAPETIQLGLAVTSHDACNPVTVTFNVGEGGVIPEEEFVRGDANSDGNINLTDGIVVLNYLFLGQAAPACMDAADADDTGAGNPSLTDAVIIFNWLFLGGPAPQPPSPGEASYDPGDCGPDPTPDDGMDCASPPVKCGGPGG
jgi:hypothetical protein